jgi:hypothetical protein
MVIWKKTLEKYPSKKLKKKTSPTGDLKPPRKDSMQFNS